MVVTFLADWPCKNLEDSPTVGRCATLHCMRQAGPVHMHAVIDMEAACSPCSAFLHLDVSNVVGIHGIIHVHS